MRQALFFAGKYNLRSEYRLQIFTHEVFHMTELRLRFLEGRRKALTLSYDDGVREDIRLMQIMDQHGLKGTFNINSGCFSPESGAHRRMSKQECYDLYANSGHEVALHALYHGDLPQLPAAHAIWQVVRDKEVLENMFGRIIRGMAYPYGTVDQKLADTLRGCGIAYSRTTESTGRFALPTDWLRMPATCHHNNPQLMTMAQAFLDDKTTRPWLFYLWGHSYEVADNDNWHVIEDFAALMGGHDEIWYATNIEIHDYIEAWRNMHISADGMRLFNPSYMPLWLYFDGNTYRIDPGCEIVLG